MGGALLQQGRSQISQRRQRHALYGAGKLIAEDQPPWCIDRRQRVETCAAAVMGHAGDIAAGIDRESMRCQKQGKTGCTRDLFVVFSYPILSHDARGSHLALGRPPY